MTCTYGYRHQADDKLKPIHAFQCFGRWDVVNCRWHCCGAAYVKVWCVFLACWLFYQWSIHQLKSCWRPCLSNTVVNFVVGFHLTFLKSLVHIWEGKTSLHSAKATMAPWGKAISLSRKLTELKTFGCKDKPSWKKKLNMLKQNYLFGGFIQASNVRPWEWKLYWMFSRLFFQD